MLLLFDNGTPRTLAHYLIAHHREDIYPDPDEFRPERFLERRYSPFEYLRLLLKEWLRTSASACRRCRMSG
jgi:cytochrome P450